MDGAPSACRDGADRRAALYACGGVCGALCIRLTKLGPSINGAIVGDRHHLIKAGLSKRDFLDAIFSQGEHAVIQ